MSEDISRFELILFDLDQTLRDFETGEVLSGVDVFFEAHGSEHQYAIITNQGGVGLRYWMEKDGFGQPENYPTEDAIRQDIENFIDGVSTDKPIEVYICFAYQSKKSGKWSPTPPDKLGDTQWSPDYRKPQPGMILRAMSDFNVTPDKVLVVGDSDEDLGAAHLAGVAFQWADHFFDRLEDFGAV